MPPTPITHSRFSLGTYLPLCIGALLGLTGLLPAKLNAASPVAPPDATNPTGEQVVYHDSLKPLGFWQKPVWSDNRSTRTPDGVTAFRGPFLAEPVTLSLSHLPAHAWVRVRFNLLVIGSWDGSSRVWGPDLWSLQVRGGQRLCFATFGNMGYFVNNNVQSYPDEYPWGRHPDWTGAAGKNELHLPRLGGGSTLENELNDGRYPIEVIFPHSGPSLVLDFNGIYSDSPKDRQSWGVTNLEVHTLSTPTVVPDEALPALWRELANEDAVSANAALWTLVTAGDRANAFITERIAELTDEVKANERGLPPVTGLEALRLHRAHRLIQILSIKGPTPCFAIDHLIPEYFNDPDDVKPTE